MAAVTINRLALNLTGISESDGKRLATLVAQGLADAPEVAASRYLDSLSVTATATPGGGMERLAEQIVADLVRQLAREV